MTNGILTTCSFRYSLWVLQQHLEILCYSRRSITKCADTLPTREELKMLCIQDRAKDVVDQTLARHGVSADLLRQLDTNPDSLGRYSSSPFVYTIAYPVLMKRMLFISIC